MTLAAVLIVLACCLAIQGFFAASEISLVTVDELKVRAEKERGARGAGLLSELLERRDRLLALALSGMNLATMIAAATFTNFLHQSVPHWEFIAPFALAPITLMLGESLPKLMALPRPLGFARFAARPLWLLAALCAPLLTVETALSRTLRRLAGVGEDASSVFLTRQDLAHLIHRPGDESVPSVDAILPMEREMISRIFRFAHSEARKAMVPLIRVAAVPERMSLADVIEVARREGFSRLPVFEERIVDIVGVIHVFDLLVAPDLSRPVREIMRPVSYFPETTALDEILLALQRTRQSLAVIVDEYGGAAGIVTVEDLIEEIVGEIEDEYDEREDLVRILDAHTLSMAARATITELNERFALKLPEADDYATIAGLIVARLGHIPKPGEQLKVGDLILTVTRSDARAVRQVNVTLATPLAVERTPLH